MKSGLMTVHNNDIKNFICDPEDCLQYCSWIISVHEDNKFQPTTTQVSTEQLDGGSIYQVFNDITMFTYIRPVKCNSKNLNGSKSPAKGLGIVIIKIPKRRIIIPLCP